MKKLLIILFLIPFALLGQLPGIGGMPAFSSESTANNDDISGATYVATYTPGTPINYQSTDIDFSPDGSIMYIFDYVMDFVYQFSLSTPWDITTASYASKSLDINPPFTQGGFFQLNADGTQLFMLGVSTKRIYNFPQTTPYDLATGSTGGYYYLGAQDATPKGIFFKPDGSKLFYHGSSNDLTYQWSLGTAWDISTLSYDNKTYSSIEAGVLQDLVFNTDGTKMYISSASFIYQYTLSTPWDITTANYDNVVIDIYADTGAAYANGFYINFSLKRIYISTGGTKTILQYNY